MTVTQQTPSTLTPTPEIGADVVSVSGVTKNFGKIEAVRGISFTIKRGEIFGLLGPNGAGKTTLINMIATYLHPSSGSISVLGLDTVRQAQQVKERIGVVPQEIALYNDLNAMENLNFFAEMYSMSKELIEKRAKELLDLMGLYERRNDAVNTYSGGMKRRLNIAVGLMNNPDLLLLDEPTVGVDPQSREAIFENIEGLKKSGLTILYTTQYMEEAERLCDHIAIIDEGKVVAIGTLEQLLALRTTQAEVQRPRGLAEVFLQLTGKRLRDN